VGGGGGEEGRPLSIVDDFRGETQREAIATVFVQRCVSELFEESGARVKVFEVYE